MEVFEIEGGQKLEGAVRIQGNKNEALPVLAASLLSPEPVVLSNLPRISDVEDMVSLIRSVGATCEWVEDHTLKVVAADIDADRLDREAAKRIRASILLAGPLLARCGSAVLPPPGGDVIGRRRLDSHVRGLEALGAEFRHDEEGYHFDCSRLLGADHFMDEASVTASENIICAAVLAHGTTILRHVACEPHVQGLCNMLNSMGARISGIGTNRLEIHGVPRLKGCTHEVGPDYLEIGSWIGLAMMTRSRFELAPVVASDLRMIRLTFAKLGVQFTIEGETLHIDGSEGLEVRSELHNEIPRIDDGIWPAFPTDLMSIAITMGTVATGTSLYFEKMFDGRMFFVDNLLAMGASIIMCDPHRVVVTGPAELVGRSVESPDIRAGMALLIAALAARGKSTIYNIRQIDRGYESIDEKLRAVGAKITRRALG